ncbi:hypothetical protein [Streptomyces sp. NPDC002746]
MPAIPVRFASHVGQKIRELPAPEREEVRAAVLRACENPWAWPAADKDDEELDEYVRVITTSAAILHYVIIPGPNPHLWIFIILA